MKINTIYNFPSLLIILIVLVIVLYLIMLWLQKDLRNAQAGIKVIGDQVDKMINPHMDPPAGSFPGSGVVIGSTYKHPIWLRKAETNKQGNLYASFEDIPHPDNHKHIDTLMDGHRVYMSKDGKLCQIIVNKDAPRVNITLNDTNLLTMFYQSKGANSKPKQHLTFIHRILYNIKYHC